MAQSILGILGYRNRSDALRIEPITLEGEFMKILTIVPAYTDYKNAGEVRRAFHAEKDFRINDLSSSFDGLVCNITDLQDDYKTVKIRYNKLADFVMIDLIA